ncbi:TrpR-like protein [Pseudoflavonifractor phocaeensis]|uniref:YerC/YecD family TrpR-related protein n=1 Tax=Pseudoflavonifractor phocaeensis TaxID=1870988 RepID=UPI00195CEF4F|nr:YerC/YecD family TrpR-related protein [Pseudoflavonifractor phocaeensis]MBM6870601.1 TrpR-like protein [Pseudoflavonifractor phocaeensis]MBM6938442.1 TrpR-like protein [Pseudoflavonifractor phocaeensis]
MSKNRKKEPNDLLYETILSLKDLDECKRFFSDLCTVAELRSMEQRFEVALLLSDGMIYNDILERTGASSATISRVNRSLQYGADGYQTVLPRVKEQLRRDGKL